VELGVLHGSDPERGRRVGASGAWCARELKSAGDAHALSPATAHSPTHKTFEFSEQFIMCKGSVVQQKSTSSFRELNIRYRQSAAGQQTRRACNNPMGDRCHYLYYKERRQLKTFLT
jgi:hypothetical protein